MFDIHNSLQSPDIGKNSDEDISDFRISGQSLIKVNCHNSRTTNDIDIKFRPVTKIDKKNKTVLKKLTMTSYHKLSHQCNFSDLWPIWSNSEAGFRMHSL